MLRPKWKIRLSWMASIGSYGVIWVFFLPDDLINTPLFNIIAFTVVYFGTSWFTKRFKEKSVILRMEPGWIARFRQGVAGFQLSGAFYKLGLNQAEIPKPLFSAIAEAIHDKVISRYEGAFFLAMFLVHRLRESYEFDLSNQTVLTLAPMINSWLANGRIRRSEITGLEDYYQLAVAEGMYESKSDWENAFDKFWETKPVSEESTALEDYTKLAFGETAFFGIELVEVLESMDDMINVVESTFPQTGSTESKTKHIARLGLSLVGFIIPVLWLTGGPEATFSTMTYVPVMSWVSETIGDDASTYLFIGAFVGGFMVWLFSVYFLAIEGGRLVIRLYYLGLKIGFSSKKRS